MAGTTRTVLNRSRHLTFSAKVRLLFGFLIGSSKKYAVKAITSGHNGRLIPKHALQLKASMSTPPITGAHESPILRVATFKLNQIDRLCDGKRCVISVREPIPNPLIPRPHMPRPMMNNMEVCAKVHTRDPNPKVVRPTMTTFFGENTVHTLPTL